jgi:hypothetical protein
MDSATGQKLDELRSDYQAVVGSPFSHFYCPIVLQDEDVDLCRAHIVNRAFPESSRNWTVQRTDVDSFYGRIFEGDFVDIQYRGKQSPDQIIVDPDLSKKLRPKILLGGEVVQHFVARGPVPDRFTEAVVGGPSGAIRLGLKIHPDDASAAMSKGCEILIEIDIRLPALVSLLKAAHLTLFEMLGYRYALSAGGSFLGRTVLGDFFLQNRDLSKADILKNAASHFREFANMVRPVLSPATTVQGTVTDRFLFVCHCEAQTPWALIVFIRTSDLLHAVLVPVFEVPSAAARFVTFLRGEGGPIQANRCRFEDDKWLAAKQPETLMWPKAELQEP